MAIGEACQAVQEHPRGCAHDCDIYSTLLTHSEATKMHTGLRICVVPEMPAEEDYEGQMTFIYIGGSLMRLRILWLLFVGFA